MSGHFVTAIILAGGTGKRLGGEVPKQFLDLAGDPLLVHSLSTFQGSQRVDAIVVVLPESRPRFIDEMIALPKVCSVTNGGETRQASLGQGLQCLPDETDVVMVHDAARPLMRDSLVHRVLEGLVEGSFHGAIPGIPIEDSIKEVSISKQVLRTRAREGIWRAQTPQAFLRGPLEDSLARADAEYFLADDCSELLLRAGYTVVAVDGDSWNLKVTRPLDLALCERILESRKTAKSPPIEPPP